ncbi:hypothetical protein DFH08DRAFT_337944 [Mycena albidolilacea]|uniref:Uncharacterized protein n=1 Tax=Mycena albidolilacea TaxID=1033008 RepID=A0AAD6ZKB0_9AGAR|nr:hypothetical protein DFH08DRAFT_337944 [Mycena albidolilacea]
MPLLCFACFSPPNDSSSVLDFDVSPGPPRRSAEEPPPLSLTAANLFDTFPRVCFGGYRRYYESRVDLQVPEEKGLDIFRSRSFKPSLSSIVEDPWSWQNLPKFSGTRRCKVRRTNSSLRETCPRLRKKPRFRSSTRPLVDSTYSWPDWLLAPQQLTISPSKLPATDDGLSQPPATGPPPDSPSKPPGLGGMEGRLSPPVQITAGHECLMTQI